jgi:putative aldouronate transport system substrate-binding protein
MKLYPDYRGTTTGLDFALSYSWQKRNLEFLDVGSKNIPIIVTDNADSSPKVFSYWELPEIKNYLTITRRWYEKGLYDLTLLSNPEQALAGWNTGKAFFIAGNAARPVEELVRVRKLVPNVRFANYFMDRGNRPLIKSRTDSTAFSLSSAVINPEAYLRFFDWWQSSQEVTDFLTFGVKGLDYNLQGESVVQINSDELVAPWVLWNTNFLRFPDFVPAEVIKNYRTWDNGATIAKGSGFIFDANPVKSERAKIEGVLQQYMLPLSLGTYTYDDKYADALKALKAAGIDKYVAEYQKQFTAFNAMKN